MVHVEDVEEVEEHLGPERSPESSTTTSTETLDPIQDQFKSERMQSRVIVG
jgi:hypothetical protein